MPAQPARPVGEVFLDARGNGRALRLTWHHEADVVVLSLWRDETCAGTFRLVKDDVNEFIDALVEGLRGASALRLGPPMGGAAFEVAPAAVANPRPTRPTRPTSAADQQPFMDWAFGDVPAQRASAR